MIADGASLESSTRLADSDFSIVTAAVIPVAVAVIAVAFDLVDMSGLVSDGELTFVFHGPGKARSGFRNLGLELSLYVQCFETI